MRIDAPKVSKLTFQAGAEPTDSAFTGSFTGSFIGSFTSDNGVLSGSGQVDIEQTENFGGLQSSISASFALSSSAHSQREAISASLAATIGGLDGDYATDAELSALSQSAHAQRGALDTAQTTAISSLSSSVDTHLDANISALSSSAHTQRGALDSAQTTANNTLSSSIASALRAEYVAGDSALSSSAHTQREAIKGLATTANNSLSSSIASGLRAEYIAADSALSASQKTYIDAKVAGVVDTAPAALDTLNELAAALGDDANFATTTATSIGEKLAKASNLSDLTNAGTARTNLGLVIGTDVNGVIGTDTDLDTSGAEVVDQINVTDGVIQSMSKRTMTLANLGYTGATDANNYSLPKATYAIRGGVKVDSDTVQTSGAVAETNTAGRTYSVQYDGGDRLVVNVPWVDTNTTYTRASFINQDVNTTDNVHFEGLMVGQTTGATANTIRCMGDVVAYYSSDEQFKDNIQTLEGALDKVKAIRGVRFDWNDKQDVYEGHDIGVIAQEVEAVLPELVHHREHNDSKAVDYVKLTAVLIEAVKELAAKVEELSK